MYLETCETLTGLSFDQVRERLHEHLDPGAYKPVPGKSYLTDIAPTSLWQTLTDCFGPTGLGWGYTITGPISLYSEQKTSRENREYTQHHADILSAEFWYAFLHGEELRKGTIPSTGSSENEDAGYAVRGAITSLIGGAARLLEWQFDIYAGLWKPGQGAATSQRARDHGTQSGPPHLFVMPFGKKHKGETMGEIERDDPKYIDWIVGNMTDKHDILGAAKAMQAKRGAPAEGTLSTPPTGPHWIKQENVRKAFWALANKLTMTDVQVHEALNVEHIEEFPGTMEQAKELMEAWAKANIIPL